MKGFHCQGSIRQEPSASRHRLLLSSQVFVELSLPWRRVELVIVQPLVIVFATSAFRSILQFINPDLICGYTEAYFLHIIVFSRTSQLPSRIEATSNMRIPQTKEQRTKACLHGAQALLIFIAACLTLAVSTTEGSLGSEIGFFFAAVRLSDRHG